MKISKLGRTEIDYLAINGSTYEFTRSIDPPHYDDGEYVLIIARKWIGRQWVTVRTWEGYK